MITRIVNWFRRGPRKIWRGTAPLDPALGSSISIPNIICYSFCPLSEKLNVKPKLHFRGQRH